MARRNPRKITSSTTPVAPAAGGAPVEIPPSEDAQANRASQRVILVVALSVFVIFMITIFAFFSTGTEIRWKKDLAAADRLYAEGDFVKAASALSRFGEDYPGAKSTFDWNRKMGLYQSAAGDFSTSATYYLTASQIKPREPGIHALAGEALWKAGQPEEAIKSLRTEIEKIPRATGDHDRANIYLGKYLLQKQRYTEAMQHFESISDRALWRAELDDAYRQVEIAVLDPARQASNPAGDPAAPTRGGS